jgi:RNA recognition motif-containing protein
LTTNIFVGNLDPCTTEEELTEAFRQFGKIVSNLLPV